MGHGVHKVAPRPLQVPGPQGTHSPALAKPREDPYVPAGQSVHVEGEEAPIVML